MIGHGPQWIGTTWRGRWSPAVSPLSDLNKLSVGPLASTASPIRSLAPIGTHINHSTYTYIGKGHQNAARLVAADNRTIDDRDSNFEYGHSNIIAVSILREIRPTRKKDSGSPVAGALEPHLTARVNGSA